MSEQVRDQLQATLGTAFTLERELGGGGMSRVFLAEETALKRKVVVKLLPPELMAGVNVDRFDREILLAAGLQHPHIVPVLTAGQSGGLPYYTMPFVDGESLRAKLARGPIPIAEAVSILRDVARALTYAHEHHIVHRDIKPDNVLLTSGSATVTDFGIAKAISASRASQSGEGLTQVGTSIGTPTYMSPEQAAGDPSTDHRADIYSFGCMAYELLAGRPPFVETSPTKLLAAHMAAIPTPISALHPDTPIPLGALVMRCLEKDPAKRPQLAADVAAALENVLSGTSGPTVVVEAPLTRARTLAYWAGTAVVVGLVAKAAIIAIGLPDWVFPGSLFVVALGLPLMLFAKPRFAARTGLMGLGSYVLLIAVFMAMRSFGIGPFGSLMASGKIKSKDKILVADFKVTNADTSLGRVLSDAAKTTLGSSSIVNLVTPQEIADALRRAQQSPSAPLQFDLARTVALRSNMKAIVDGEVTGLGAAGYIVTLKLVTTDSLRELATFRETATDAAGLIKAIDKLSRSLRERLGESLRQVHNTASLTDATTSSMEALRKFSEGNRLVDQQNDPAKAAEVLREAVKIDPTFAMAWRKLAVALSNSASPRSSSDSAMVQAFKYKDRLTDKERLLVEAYYYGSGPGRDRAKAVEAYRNLAALGDSSASLNNLALILTQRREFARAESLYRAAERNCPGCVRVVSTNLAATLLREGKVDAADSIQRALARERPNDRNPRRQLINNLYVHGDTSRFRAALDSIVAKGDSADKGFVTLRRSAFLLTFGQVAQWRKAQIAFRPDTLKETPRQKLNRANSNMDAYVQALILDKPKAVESLIDAARAGFDIKQLPEQDRPYLQLATQYSWAGRPDKARELVRQFDTENRDTAFIRSMIPNRQNAMGDIYLAEKKYDEAVSEYRKSDVLPDGPATACDICLSFELARAFDLAGKTDSAIAHYEHALSPTSAERSNYDPIILAPFSYRLGALYEQKGDVGKARKYYTDFVNLWKSADPELQPRVAEARARLAKLGAVEGVKK